MTHISFAQVYKAIYQDHEGGNHAVAVKTMRVSKISERELVKFKDELIIMSCNPGSAVRYWTIDSSAIACPVELARQFHA